MIELVRVYGCQHPQGQRVQIVLKDSGRSAVYCRRCGSLGEPSGRKGWLRWTAPDSQEIKEWK